MTHAKAIISQVANQTNRAILFHSATGKDSIALLELMAPHFKEIICVYMFIVPGLSHINRYISYATNRYPNIKFFQVPHFALSSYYRNGYMGCPVVEGQKLISFADLTESVRSQTGVDWAFYGFKKSDSMNRRLMLMGYREEAINDAQRKCYPLSGYLNREVLEYIDRQELVRPESYGKGQSAGTNITDIDYLLFLRDNYPEDLKRVLQCFPKVERILFEHDYKEKEERAKAE